MSNDGKWRSFPKVPHLLQYASNGNYYGRIKIDGKIIRESLQTRIWTTAELRLTDFLMEHQENSNKVDPPKFSEAVELYKRELDGETGIKRRSKEYRQRCLNKIQRTWPRNARHSRNQTPCSSQARSRFQETMELTPKSLGKFPPARAGFEDPENGFNDAAIGFGRTTALAPFGFGQ